MVMAQYSPHRNTSCRAPPPLCRISGCTCTQSLSGSFVSFEVLSFICFGLFVAFLSSLHMMQEAKTRANKLTQRLKRSLR
jgi:hypothetical protein